MSSAMELVCATPLLHVQVHRKCCDWYLRKGCMACWGVVCIVAMAIVFMGWVPTLGDQAKKVKASKDEQFPGGVDLWYGIQWWGKGDTLHPVINSDTGMGQGMSEHFDPAKPTMIYVHGWQPGRVSSPGLERLTSYTGVHMADAWIDQGWNVGTFFWMQFADTLNVLDAENKIWDTCVGSGKDKACWPNQKMTWRGRGGKSHAPRAAFETKSAGQLLFDSIVASLPQPWPEGFKLRLVGHSLGGSMVAAAGLKLAEAGLVPDRVAMVDPFWSPGNERRVIAIMRTLYSNYKVTVEVTRASSFSAPARYGDAMKEVAAEEKDFFFAFSWHNPTYVTDLGIEWLAGVFTSTLKHRAAKSLYLLSIDPNNPNADSGPSAATANMQLQTVVESGKFWRQIKGTRTETIMDDEYELVDWKNEPPLSGASVEAVVSVFVLLNITAWGLCLCCCCNGAFHATRRLKAWKAQQREALLPEDARHSLAQPLDELGQDTTALELSRSSLRLDPAHKAHGAGDNASV